MCSVAPIPGETKVWQYIKLSRNVLIIDCPGVIHQSDDPNDTHQAVLKGVVRVERMASEVCGAVKSGFQGKCPYNNSQPPTSNIE